MHHYIQYIQLCTNLTALSTIYMGRTAKLVFTTETGSIFNYEIDVSEGIENVKALVEVEVRTIHHHSQCTSTTNSQLITIYNNLNHSSIHYNHLNYFHN